MPVLRYSLGQRHLGIIGPSADWSLAPVHRAGLTCNCMSRQVRAEIPSELPRAYSKIDRLTCLNDAHCCRPYKPVSTRRRAPAQGWSPEPGPRIDGRRCLNTETGVFERSAVSFLPFSDSRNTDAQYMASQALRSARKSGWLRTWPG